MITANDIRTRLPAFASTADYPDEQLGFYIALAYKLLSADRWGDVLDDGATLFVAHWAALDIIGQAGGGGVAGAAVGVLTGGTVDKVSYSRDVSSVMEEGAGHWGMTTYGLQFLRLARMMGTGPLHLGGLQSGDQSLYSGAWQGVMPGPF